MKKECVELGQKRPLPLTAVMNERPLKIGTRNPENRFEEITKGLYEINKQTKDFLASIT